MMLAALPTVLTPEDLEAMGEEGLQYEILYGVPREVEGMSERHGAIAGRLHVYLGSYVLDHELGEIFSSDTRFVFPTTPPSVLAPDIAFISATRLAATRLAEGFSRRVPDLVVEVASPSNSEAKILQKISIYLANGVRAVWLVRPGPRTVTIFRPDGPEVILTGDQELDGGDILPGFRLPIARLFRLLDETAS
ncbi:MAG: hypothetical protein C4346_12355 [Chloroflexota bacterium]